MNDDQLRALVRSAVARHLGRTEPLARSDSEPRRGVMPADPGHVQAQTQAGHVSHHLYVTLVNAGDACVIEPSVPCDHCGFCKSHGH